MTYSGAQTSNNTIFYVDVLRNKLSVTVLPGPGVIDAPSSYERLCVREFEDNKYLVQHFDVKEKGSHYLCMQFIVRNEHVVQWKLSAHAKSDDEALCDDSALTLDPWPLVKYDTENNLDQTHHCPFTGGYNIQLTDTIGEDLCTEKYTSPRLEVSCRDDAMLHLDFHTCRYHRDIVGMEIRQKLECAGHWTDGGDTYVVLKRNGVSMFWLLHIPVKISESFYAYLSSDVVIHSGDSIRLSNRFIKLKLERKLYPSTCEDVSVVCTGEGSTCDADDVFADMYCRRTCGRCNHTTNGHNEDKTKGHGCKRLGQLAGYWKSLHSMTTNNHLTVGTDASLEVNDVRSECIEYDPWTSTYSLLHFSQDGCHPRYHCLTTHPVTHSVLLYRYSPGPYWPVYGARHLCANFLSHNTLSGTASHFHLAVMTSQQQAMPCDFPVGTFTSFAVFPDGTACHGYFSNPSCSVPNNSSILTVQHTKCNHKHYEGSYNLTCLAHMPSVSTRTLILVAKNTDPVEYYCLYFISQLAEFVVLPGDKCHEVYKNKDVTANFRLTEISDKCPRDSGDEMHSNDDIDNAIQRDRDRNRTKKRISKVYKENQDKDLNEPTTSNHTETRNSTDMPENQKPRASRHTNSSVTGIHSMGLLTVTIFVLLLVLFTF